MISINLKSSQLTAERKLCTADRADFSALVNINLRSAQSSRINPMHSLWKFIGEEFKCLDFTTLKTMIMNQETEIPIKCLPLSLHSSEHLRVYFACSLPRFPVMPCEYQGFRIVSESNLALRKFTHLVSNDAPLKHVNFSSSSR